MARKPSAATELRNYKRLYNEALHNASAVSRERDAYRVRATKAEQELSEWKRRFDALLKIMPPSEGARGV